MKVEQNNNIIEIIIYKKKTEVKLLDENDEYKQYDFSQPQSYHCYYNINKEALFFYTKNDNTDALSEQGMVYTNEDIGFNVQDPALQYNNNFIDLLNYFIPVIAKEITTIRNKVKVTDVLSPVKRPDSQNDPFSPDYSSPIKSIVPSDKPSYIMIKVAQDGTCTASQIDINVSEKSFKDNDYCVYYDIDKEVYFSFDGEKSYDLSIEEEKFVLKKLAEDEDDEVYGEDVLEAHELFLEFLSKYTSNVDQAKNACLLKINLDSQDKSNYSESESKPSNNNEEQKEPIHATQTNNNYLNMILALSLATFTAGATFLLFMQILSITIAALASLTVGAAAGFALYSIFNYANNSNSEKDNVNANQSDSEKPEFNI
jgi:hypothetical protein